MSATMAPGSLPYLTVIYDGSCNSLCPKALHAVLLLIALTVLLEGNLQVLSLEPPGEDD